MEAARETFLKEWILPFLTVARRYHQHEVIGLKNIPSQGRAILAMNHSLATYDMALLGSVIFEQLGRLPRALADRWFFRWPIIGHGSQWLGAKEGSYKEAITLLNDEELIAVAPGGMKEALRSSKEKYKIYWSKRQGFAKLSIETQSPLILALCPKADDLYDVYETFLTHWAYEKFKIPLIFARGFGPTFLPKPIPLTHFVSEPLYPPSLSSMLSKREKFQEDFHKKILTRAQDLMEEALAYIPPSCSYDF